MPSLVTFVNIRKTPREILAKRKTGIERAAKGGRTNALRQLQG
jgi:hypothetical protein